MVYVHCNKAVPNRSQAWEGHDCESFVVSLDSEYSGSYKTVQPPVSQSALSNLPESPLSACHCVVAQKAQDFNLGRSASPDSENPGQAYMNNRKGMEICNERFRNQRIRAVLMKPPCVLRAPI